MAVQPPDYGRLLNDVLGIIQNALDGNDLAILPKAVELLQAAILLLPPIDAPALDPDERAKIDAAADAEAAADLK